MRFHLIFFKKHRNNAAYLYIVKKIRKLQLAVLIIFYYFIRFMYNKFSKGKYGLERNFQNAN